MDNNSMIWFADEVYFTLNSSLSYTWGERGKKIVIETNCSKGKDCVIGAVEPYEGQSYFLEWDAIDSTAVSKFIEDISEIYPEKKHIIIFDNASYHRCQGNEEFPLPENIQLLFIPPYSPDFNLIENLWKVLKEDFFNNKLFKSLKEFKDHVCNILKLVMSQKDIVLSACGIH